MINIIDKIYSSLRRKDSKYESFMRFIIREFTNTLLPQYLKFTRKKLQLSDNDIIVSLTTFPQRIDKIWMVVECVLRQSILPQKIVLWLSKTQFPNELADIPENLLYYQRKGLLDIRFVDEDLRSHKKYFYALQEFPQSKIIVLDDDIFYPSTVIKDLIKLNEEYPNNICCLRAHKVAHDSEGNLLAYKKWPKVFHECGPSFALFHTSGGGTLYKKNFFDEDVFDKDVFMEKCKYADDVWLNIMAQKAKTKTIKSSYFSNLLPIKSNSFKLSKNNVSNFGNDLQIKNVIEYYKLDSKKLFKDFI